MKLIKQIETLKSFFIITTFIFSIMDSVILKTNGEYNKRYLKLQALHKLILKELLLTSRHPDLLRIDIFMEQI